MTEEELSRAMREHAAKMTDDYADEIPFPPTQGNIRQSGLVEHNAHVKAQREADCAKAQRTITTEEAELMARMADLNGPTRRGAIFRSLAAERDALRARVAELEGVLRPIACDCVDVEEDCYNDVEPGDDCVCFKARAALGEKQ
jgi:hypothetical protein